MEAVGAIVGCKLVGLSIQREGGVGNAVGHTAHQRAKIWRGAVLRCGPDGGRDQAQKRGRQVVGAVTGSRSAPLPTAYTPLIQFLIISPCMAPPHQTLAQHRWQIHRHLVAAGAVLQRPGATRALPLRAHCAAQSRGLQARWEQPSRRNVAAVGLSARPARAGASGGKQRRLVQLDARSMLRHAQFLMLTTMSAKVNRRAALAVLDRCLDRVLPPPRRVDVSDMHRLVHVQKTCVFRAASPLSRGRSLSVPSRSVIRWIPVPPCFGGFYKN